MFTTLLAALALAAPTVTAKIDGFTQPCGSAAVGKYLYVDSYASGVLHRVDPATNRIVKSAKVASSPCGVVAGAGSLWIEDYAQNAILRVNPKTMKLMKRIFVGKKPWDVAFGFNAVWSSNAQSASISRIDPRKNRVVKTIGFAGSPTCIRTGAGYVWVGVQNADFVFRVDPKTNKGVQIPIGHGSELCVDPHPDGVWVSDDVAGSVTHIAVDGTVLATIKVGTRPGDGTRGPDGLEWVPNLGDGTLTRIDPKTDTVVDTIPLVGSPFVARTAFGSVWIGDFRGTQLWRVTP
jgi:streptogramin lyase